MPFCLGLTQLAEANATWEQPIVNALHRFTTLMHSMLADNYTGYIYHEGDQLDEGDFQWGRVRSQDMMITLQWLYEKHPGNQSQVLFDNMNFLHNGSLAWEDWYDNAAYFGQGIENDLYTVSDNITVPNYPYEHGVNVGQGMLRSRCCNIDSTDLIPGLKAVAVVRRFTHNDSLIQTAMDGVTWTMTYHGAASGTVIADERLVGLSPYSGSELCTAVETMYSLSYLYQSLGTNCYADRAELTAFNALPAMLTPDWWGRQYMEEPNQPYAVNLTATPFYNTNSWGQTFGLEPNYPCCTVNHPQGWPKFLSSSWVAVGDNGLAHVLLSPGSVTTSLPSGNVTVTCETNYPFDNTLSYTIQNTGNMDFYVRIPAWATNTSSLVVSTTKDSHSTLSPDPATGLQKISLPASNGQATSVSLTLSSNIRTEARANETVAVYHGALLYALEVGATNTSTIPKMYNEPDTFYPAGYAPPQSRDWEYHNTTAWNVAIDVSTLKFHSASVKTLANPIFAPGAPPTYITAQACQIDWPLYLDSVPGYPPTGDAKNCLGDAFQVKLVPYGAAKLHMADMPTIDLSNGTASS